MRTLRFDALLSGEKWISPAYVRVDANGNILSIENQSKKADETIHGWAIPGFKNKHSHAFQYAMAGLAESSTAEIKSNFWTWREKMYDISLRVTPEELQAIATVAYSEMVRNGFTSVTEFHYVHHDPRGKPYANPCEMGERLQSAADEAGIQLTLVPVFYRWSDFAKKNNPRQRRFIFKSIDQYWSLIEKYQSKIPRLGIGIHSLRGANADESIDILTSKIDLQKHLHIAEQIKEVETCKKVLKTTPVCWLLDHVNVDASFHLVHCTHIDKNELLGIAKSKAEVVLCPSTEGNLGDGFFPIGDYNRANGRWSIGTDSHVGLNPLEELRWLDYTFRLKTNRRSPNVPAYFKANKFEIGAPFNSVIVASNHPLLESTPVPRRLATLIYCGDTSMFQGTVINGKWRSKTAIAQRAMNIYKEFRKKC